MEFWIDSINPKNIRKYVELGILTGVTTNPELLTQVKSIDKTLHDIIEVNPGLLAVQVVADSADEMVAQGKVINDLSDRMLVKVPVTHDGLKAIHRLTEANIPTVATVVFSPQQALTAAKAGADYVALYLTRFEKSGGSWKELLHSTSKVFSNYHLETKILAASISSAEQVEKCAELGIHAVTMREEIFDKLIEEQTLTLEAIEQFKRAWKAESAELFKVKTII